MNFTRRRLASCALCASLAATAWQAALAYRPYSERAQAKTSWMTVSSAGREYYMELSSDGEVLTRTETKNSIVTRRGAVKKQLARDFFREIESSDIIISQGTRESKLLFYEGDKLTISAYVSGEIRRRYAPLVDFGEAFSYAFSEVRNAAEELPVDAKIGGFIMAEPLEKDSKELKEYEAKAPKGIKTVETHDIQKLAPLMKAIRQPYRLIPIEGGDGPKTAQAFITLHGLYGIRRLFYLPSTRGTFRCLVLDAARAPLPRERPEPGTDPEE